MGTAVNRGLRREVRVFKDLDALSLAAAGEVVSLSKEAIALHETFAVALSGGSTPKGLYSLLGQFPYRDEIDWKRVLVFWADERCVPPTHPESNFRLAFDAFLSKVSPPAENIRRIAGEEDPGRAAEQYEQDIRSHFGAVSFPTFDLMILGAGGDGHTASLFPGSDVLREKKRLAAPVYLEPAKRNRVTLTLPVLNHAAKVLFLAAGRAKAGVVHEILENGNPKQYPAGLIEPVRGSVTWMIDQEAAGSLTGSLLP